MSYRIGFIINPIAGMGGRVGLKGTDGVYDEAVKRGAKPVASVKAEEMLKEYISSYSEENDIEWYTCSNSMGGDVLEKAGVKDFEIVYESSKKTSSVDTKKACECFLNEKLDLVLFCGGDGTARDVFQVVGTNIPLLGVPCGVKMHSGVFAVSTSAAARMLHEFVNQLLRVGDVDILDLDEDRYRLGEWNIKLFGVARGIVEPTYVQVGKTSFESVSDDEILDELAEHVADEMNENSDFLFLMGSGGTIDHIMGEMKIENTLLGIDAVYKSKLLQADINEKQILDLLEKYPMCKVVLSPIGAQGFILGRGNLQLSPRVVRKIGFDNFIIIATPSKLASTPVLRVDTGDKRLDQSFMKKDFMMVVIGYHFSRVVKIQN